MKGSTNKKQPYFIIALIFSICAWTSSYLIEVNKPDLFTELIPEDSVKIQILLDSASNIINSRPDESLGLLFRADSIAHFTDKLDLRARIYYLVAVSYKNLGLLDSAIIANGKSLDFYQIGNDSSGIAYCANLEGSILLRQGNLYSALQKHNLSLKIFERLKDSLGIIKTCNYIGNVYKELSLYDSASSYYFRLITLSDRLKYVAGELTGKINLGQVLIELGELQKAKDIISQSIELSMRQYSQKNLALCYSKFGGIFYQEKKYDSARYYFEKSKDIYQKINYNLGIGNSFLNIASCYLDQDNLKEAQKFYMKSYAEFSEIKYSTGILRVQINLALLFDKMKFYALATKYYDSCVVLAKKLNAKNELLDIYNNMHFLFQNSKQYEKSLTYLNKYVKLKDSIYNLEKAKIINDLELKYETEKKESKILALNNENLKKDLQLHKANNRQNMFLTGGGLFFLLSIFTFLFFRQRIRKNRQLAEQKLLKAEKEKKLSSAQALIEGQEEERIRISKELHDGVGVLLSTATLYLSSIDTKSSNNTALVNKAHKIVDDANSDVRRISRDLMPTVLALYGLDEALTDMIDNIKNLPGKNAEFLVIGKSKALAKNREAMLYRLIQEMISNTMKHANANTVKLILEYKENELYITYSDDGTGFDFEKEFMKKSVGLKSIQSRLDFLKGKLNYRADQGSTYTISIPLQTEV